MNNEQQRLKRLLADLNDSLPADADIDPATRENLQLLETKVNGLSTAKRDDESPIQLAYQLESQFEADHPHASTLLRDILSTLHNMGI